MLGKVTNFNWKFNDDGSYDIKLNLIGMGDIIESLKVNKSVVSQGKVELTPSESLNKRQASIDGARKSNQNKRDKASGQNEKNQKALDDYINSFNKFYENLKGTVDTKNTTARTISQLLDSAFDLGSGQDNDVAREINSIRSDLATLDSIILTSDSKPEDIRTSLRESREKISGLINFADNQDKDLGSKSDFRKLLNKSSDLIQQAINKLPKDKDSLFTRVAASKNAEDVKEQNEALNEEISAIQKSINKEKEILSLSPVTSVENKNKTLFNLQLYDWREQARKGKDKTNLYKQTMTANSANPDSTGVSTLSLDFYYVRLGRMLEWIEKNLLVYDDTKKDPDSDDNEPNPIFKIDYNPETNFCLRFPAQFSSDPTVCLIPSKTKSDIAQWDILPNLSDYFVEGDDYKGKLMNIFINIDHAQPQY
jgi:hypothetical protein